MRFIILLIILGAIGFGIYWYLVPEGATFPDANEIVDNGNVPVTPTPTTSVFSTAQYSFSPDITKNGFTLKEDDGVNGLFAKGQSFFVPLSMTAGTNLSTESRIHIQITAASSTLAQGCDPANQGVASGHAVLPNKQGSNGLVFVGGRSVEAAAGSTYDSTVYTLERNNKCYTIIKYLRSGNIYNYDPGTVREFDAAAIEAYYDQVIRTFKIK